jgi:hypothetical protein
MVALIDSAFDTVTVAPHTARVIMARHAAAGVPSAAGCKAGTGTTDPFGISF